MAIVGIGVRYWQHIDCLDTFIDIGLLNSVWHALMYYCFSFYSFTRVEKLKPFQYIYSIYIIYITWVYLEWNYSSNHLGNRKNHTAYLYSNINRNTMNGYQKYAPSGKPDTMSTHVGTANSVFSKYISGTTIFPIIETFLGRIAVAKF